MITVKAPAPDASPADPQQGLRALIRSSEIGIVVLASLIGILAGLVVVAMSMATQLMHELVFGIASGQRLSVVTDIPSWRAVAGPVAGGLVVGGTATSSFNTTKAGWTVGGGVEGVISGNWTAKIEYLYLDLGTINSTYPGVAPFAPASLSSHVTDNLLRVGLNYHFH